MVLLVKNMLASAGDLRDIDSITGLGRYPGEGHGSPLQESCLDNPMGRGAWLTIVFREPTHETLPLKRP